MGLSSPLHLWQTLFGHQPLSYAIALLTDLQHACTVSTGQSCCWHHYSRQHRDTWQISWGHHCQHQRPGTEGFLKVNEGKAEQFVSSDVLLLQLANNGDGISGACTIHKSELHFDVHHLADVGVQYLFHQLYDLICELETTIVATVKVFSLMGSHHSWKQTLSVVSPAQLLRWQLLAS